MELEVNDAVLVYTLDGLILNPVDELRFNECFDENETVLLKINNPTEKKIAFKIKTREFKSFCVKPNAGVFDPAKIINANCIN
jgi:vesicle-associated membrane protein-associated protein A